MIRDIKELNFPKYATLSQANIRISDMGDMTIEADVKIDGNKSPDFTYDWMVEFKGETYIMPLRKPQGSKDNTSVNSVVSLTFHHWAIYELKRYFFVTTTNNESGVVVADQYEASMSLNLKDFVTALNNVLSHYLGGKIAAVLNPSWGGSDEAKILDLSYTKVWDVLTSVYDLYAVRWYIETGEDGVCYIKIGYPTQNITHVFKYGYEGGLLKVERQVQSSDIYNVILGRGGSINLPLRYFKDVDSQNPSFASDPDWIPELSNIYFTGLRDAAFRSYVQGWKKKHYGGTVEKTSAYVKWAYEKGYTDTKFNPTEYVKSDESIKSYGEIWGAVENNEEIYPTIRNFSLPLIGRVDELVDVEEITEHIDTEGDYEEIPIAGRKFNSIKDIPIGGKGEAKKPLGIFTISKGKIGNFVEPIVDYEIRRSDRTQGEAIKNPVSIPDFVYKIYNTKGEQIPLSGIPEGTYRIETICTLVNKEGFPIKIDYEYRDTIVQCATPKEDYNPYVFSIWVKNLWDTYKRDGETAEQYAARVWNPILGDRDKNEAVVKFAEGLLAVSSDYEFKIVKLPEFDDSKRFNDVESHWKITLSKSDADMESTGEYVPNKRINARAGEHFYFQGVDLPYMYYTEAEKRLTEYKELKLRETEDIKPTWVVNLDRVRISKVLEGESTPLLEELKIGRSIYLEDSRFITSKNSLGNIVPTAPESLYIQSITYTYRQPSSNDAALIPDVEIVLTDNYLTTADRMSMIENEVDSMKNQIDAISNVTTFMTAIGNMFKLVNNIIKVLLPFDGISFVASGASNRIKEFVTFVSDKLEDFNAWKMNVTAVPSVASVFAFVAAFVTDYSKRFFRRDIPDTNPNKVTFGEVSVEKGLENVDGSSSGNLSVQGTLSAGSAAFAPAIVDGAIVPTTTVDADGIKTRKEAKMRTVVFGDYLPGLITGAEQGAKVTESGDASFRSVSISGYLEVPEIRFNRATVQLGIGIRSVGGGIIEEVIPDTDADGNPLMSGRAALKLEDGEIGAIEVGDKCLGFWHNLTGNSTADRDDRNGDYELRGFSSVYFRIDAIFASEQAYRDYDTAATDDGCINKYFHYVLRGSDGTDGWNQRHHPSPNMHFGMIANNIYPDRQALKIETTRYDLSLTRMTEWNYTHSNIVEVGGLIDGFSMQAERYNEVTGEYETYTKEFKGHGRVLGQCYIFGQIDKFERQGYYCTVFQSKNGFIMPNETEMETVRVYTGYGEEVTEKFPYIKVTRDSGDSASDAVWNAEHTSVDNPFPITFADLRIDAIERISTEFHVYASDGINQTRTSTITFE